jgi:hypothetical protein
VDDYPSNSRRSKETKPELKPLPSEKRVERVVEGDVQRRKTPLGKRLATTFLGGDARSVFTYVIMEVLIPSAKDTISDVVSQGIERMLFGEARSTTRRNAARTGGSTGYVSYNRYSSNPPAARTEPRNEISKRGRATHDFDEIILATRAEAEEVIGRLFDIVAKYEAATVADLYEMLGIETKFTDDRWGWTDLRGAGVTHIRGGYLLDLPRPDTLD